MQLLFDYLWDDLKAFLALINHENMVCYVLMLCCILMCSPPISLIVLYKAPRTDWLISINLVKKVTSLICSKYLGSYN